MTYLAGFDIVIEMGEEAITRVLFSQAQLEGQPLYIPGEIYREVNQSGASGSFHALTEKLKVNILANNKFKFELDITGGSFIGEYNGVQAEASLLQGSISATIPLAFKSAYDQMQELSIDMSNASFAVNLNSSDTFWSLIQLAIEQALTDLIREIQFPPISAFKVVPNELGSLDPMQFTAMELQTKAGTPGRIELFANLRVDAGGVPVEKTLTKLSAHKDVVISLSEDALNQAILAPIIADKIGRSINDLPAPVGTKRHMSYQGLKINRLGTNLLTSENINGKLYTNIILFFVRGSKSDTCYDATASLKAYITVGVTEGVLNVDIIDVQENVDVDMPWYCEVAAAILSLGTINESFVEDILEGIAEFLVDRFMSSINSNLFSFDSDGLLVEGYEVSLAGAEIDDTAMYLSSTIDADGTLPALSAGVDYVRNSTRGEGYVLERGSFDAETCRGENTYNWERIGYNNRSSITPIPQRLARPVKYRWILTSLSGETVLEDGSGVLNLRAECSYYQYGMNDPEIVTQVVDLEYFFEGDTLNLINDAEDGQYSIHIRLEATDALGTQVYEEMLFFSGGSIVDDDGYQNDLADCVRQKMEANLGKMRFAADKRLIDNLLNPLLPEFIDEGCDPLPPWDERSGVLLRTIEDLADKANFSVADREYLLKNALVAAAVDQPFMDAQVMPFLSDYSNVEASPGLEYLQGRELGVMVNHALSSNKLGISDAFRFKKIKKLDI